MKKLKKLQQKMTFSDQSVSWSVCMNALHEICLIKYVSGEVW